jgi:uncharacterized protein (TIGR02118 family)
MFKAIILLERNHSATRADFAAWWLGEHAGLARRLPGLRGLRFNLVESDDVLYDGVAELWFDSREAFEAAYASEIGRQVAADSLTHVARRERLFAEEHTLLPER